jgi:hypothetical protein
LVFFCGTGLQFFLDRLASMRRRREKDATVELGSERFASAPPRFTEPGRALVARAAAKDVGNDFDHASGDGGLLSSASSSSASAASFADDALLRFDSKMAAPASVQFAACLARAHAALWRNSRFVGSRVASPFVFSLILGVLCWQVPLDVRGAFGRVAVLFFCCTIPNYSSAAVIPLAQSRRLLLARERAVHTCVSWVAFSPSSLGHYHDFII